jgi:UDPglucose 6-dehydrogenase
VLGDEPRITYATNPNDALLNADALVIVTEWKEFRSPDFELIKERLKQPLIVDGRNLYDPALVRGMGFDYLAIGR